MFDHFYGGIRLIFEKSDSSKNLYDFENVTAKIEAKKSFNMDNMNSNFAALFASIMFLSACGGGGGGASVPTTTYTWVAARAAKKSKLILAQQ